MMAADYQDESGHTIPVKFQKQSRNFFSRIKNKFRI